MTILNFAHKCYRFSAASYQLAGRKAAVSQRGRIMWQLGHAVAGAIAGYSLMAFAVAKLGTLAALALWCAGIVLMLGYFWNRAKRMRSAATLEAILAAMRKNHAQRWAAGER